MDVSIVVLGVLRCVLEVVAWSSVLNNDLEQSVLA
jgi:hypothetical protein